MIAWKVLGLASAMRRAARDARGSVAAAVLLRDVPSMLASGLTAVSAYAAFELSLRAFGLVFAVEQAVRS